MERICRDVSAVSDLTIMKEVEQNYNIIIPDYIKTFFAMNNGGIPIKKELCITDEEYEIRCFLSFNKEDYNSIYQPLENFMKQTKGKIFPIAKDSGDNYYCINLKTEEIFIYVCETNLYYKLFNNFAEMINLIK